MTLKASALKVGDTHKERVVENLSRTQIVQYAGASGDYNPLHTDEVYATKVAGYPSIFAHGMLTMGATGRLLTEWVGGQPAVIRPVTIALRVSSSKQPLADEHPREP